MKTPPTHRSGPGGHRRAAFSLMELLFSTGISAVVLAVTGTFIAMAARSTSGIVQQSLLNTQAGRSSEFIFNRVRFATSIANDASGNTLTLGFDDNINVDSDGDKITYNDKDHFEIFQFLTNAATADNQLVYYRQTNAAFGATNVLIKSSLGRLPGKSVFVVTNFTVLLNYVLADNYAGDGYQSCAVQAAFVARNRPKSSTVIAILP